MKQTYSPALKARRALLVACATLAVSAALLLGFTAFAVGLLASRHPELGLGWAVSPIAALFLAAVWVSAWVWRVHRELARFGWRPAAADRQVGMSQASRHAVWAAEGAFDRGAFGGVPAFLERIPEPERGAGVWTLLGRSRALTGDVDGAEAALTRAGARPRELALLRGGRSAAAAGLPHRLARVPAMGVLVLALLALAFGARFFVGDRTASLAGGRSFDEADFRCETDGRIAFYYHDPVFLAQAQPLAQAALDADLGFLGLGSGAFGPGELRIYLCDSDAEYRRRAPSHPAWEAACADPPRATVYIHGFGGDAGGRLTFEVVLAHELGHLCYYRLVGASPDDWLNEGLADYLGFKFALDREGIPRQAWLQDHFFQGLRAQALPFGRFFKTDPRDLPDAQVATFYRQGFSVVYFLIEDYGQAPFLVFLRALRGGGDVDRALGRAYPTIPDVTALAAVWGLFYPEPAARPGTGP